MAAAANCRPRVRRDPLWCPWCDKAPCELGDSDACEKRFVYALPPGPMCARCGHELCPCCPLPWCDILVLDDAGPDYPATVQIEDSGLCCGGSCVVPWDDFDAWREEVNAVEAMQPEGHSVIVTADGPWLPAAVRRARGLPCWRPPPVFADAPAVVSLLAGVRLWQRHKRLDYADGLIGPATWARRDSDLLALAMQLKRELDAADLGFTQLGRFLALQGACDGSG